MAHRLDDARRSADGTPYPPFHDVMVAVDGDAAAAVDDVARRRWTLATGHALPAVIVEHDPWPESLQPRIVDARVGVACTAPPAPGREGLRDIEQLYLDMIARAKRYLSHRRFEVYYLHVDGLAKGTCVDVHSKVMVVDDEWLRIGWSNISNRSMGMDTECDIVVEAQADDRKARAIRAFRDDLVAEHAGVERSELAAAIERQGSLIAAIGRLGTPVPKLMPLGDIPQYPDALIDAVSITDPEKPVSLEALMGKFETNDTRDPSRAPPWKAIGAVVAGLIALALAWKFTPLSDWLSVENATAWASRFSDAWWAPLLLMSLYTPASIIMFPRPVLTLTAILVFGPLPGFAYAMAGILLATTTHYWAGCMFKRDTVRRVAGGRLNKITGLLRKHGVVAMTAVRLVPMAPFFVPGIVAGAIRLRLWRLLLGTFLGMLPGSIVTVVFADQMRKALAEGGRVNYWAVAGVILMFAAILYGVRRWFKRIDAGNPVTRKSGFTSVRALE